MPPSTRQPHDPFTSSSTALRQQTSHQSLRSNASSASARRLARRVESDVLADTESEQETRSRQRPQVRKLRHGPPAKKEEEQDIVNRRPDGMYFLNGTVSDLPNMADVFEQQATDAYYSDLARKYFTSGAHMSTRTSRQAEDDFERELHEVTMRLREDVMQKIEDERWLYEPSDRFRPG